MYEQPINDYRVIILVKKKYKGEYKMHFMEFK
jgi:hypothetical protein